jgi:hypothetical protein
MAKVPQSVTSKKLKKIVRMSKRPQIASPANCFAFDDLNHTDSDDLHLFWVRAEEAQRPLHYAKSREGRIINAGFARDLPLHYFVLAAVCMNDGFLAAKRHRIFLSRGIIRAASARSTK